ncbi:DUF805 domain-containing protein [Shimia thalassica]|uniref:DUF805 domain-containing protein n=1 Tax=Shimia thalassica TaxID=1715693 RepID=UPI002735E076|nr:DUF805 domain-containing protein [Shimia thalassica]MDP2519250.1 DUF805 domain-containing protein [Shimia thalassica]
MEKLFKRMIWFGLVGVIAAFCLGVYFTSDLLLGVLLAFSAAFICGGVLGRLWFKAKVQLERPEVEQAVQQAATKAVSTGTEVAKAGVATGLRLLPSLRYLFSFSGRVTRKEYWIVQIATGVVQLGSIVWLVIDANYATPWLLLLVSMAVLLAFGVRRTRDTGVNQWWFLLVLVAPVNLALLVFLLLVPTDEFRDSRL